jgi:glycosyltransferase involved in cell wall biosynthesis
MSAAPPLVSILIPAYHDRFFAEALASARAQTWPALEIVVLDDSAGEAIEAIAREARDPRVRYRRNRSRLGFDGNFTACLEEARGDLVKFLNDDDRLHPQCVAELAGALSANASVALATSRRFVIDERGARRPDTLATVPLSLVSAFIPGAELGNFVLMNMRNLIGEPSTAMFRRSQLACEPGSVFRWGARTYHCLADMSLWLRLLARGAAYYCATGLSEFRMHPGQEQEGAARLDCLLERLWIARQARASGFLADRAQWLAALGAVRAFASGTDFSRVAALDAERIRDHVREVEAEIARASTGEPRPATL